MNISNLNMNHVLKDMQTKEHLLHAKKLQNIYNQPAINAIQKTIKTRAGTSKTCKKRTSFQEEDRLQNITKNNYNLLKKIIDIKERPGGPTCINLGKNKNNSFSISSGYNHENINNTVKSKHIRNLSFSRQ